uniref:Uncharacterized protein n=1 Tax=Oryza glumipatula TaxID=40148 RepID=A0A0E0B3Z9_9ORYZ
MSCCHIHQYDRLYEARKVLCPSCRQPFVAEEMAEPPPIVPGTDMYYCTWGFFPVGFPGCPGFEKLISSQQHGTDQPNTPWLGTTGGAEADGVAGAENGAPVSAAVEVQSAPKPAKPVRVKQYGLTPNSGEAKAAPPVDTMTIVVSLGVERGLGSNVSRQEAAYQDSLQDD